MHALLLCYKLHVLEKEAKARLISFTVVYTAQRNGSFTLPSKRKYHINKNSNNKLMFCASVIFFMVFTVQTSSHMLSEVRLSFQNENWWKSQKAQTIVF